MVRLNCCLGTRLANHQTDLLLGVAHTGAGKYTYVKGGYFEGTWLNGLKTDKGVQVFPDGGRYEGASQRFRQSVALYSCSSHGIARGLYVSDGGR